MVNFQNYSSSDNCGYCYETMKNSDVVAHAGPHGKKHPLHRECFKTTLLVTQNKCPFCQIHCNPNSLNEPPPSLKDKIIRELKGMGKDAVIGITICSAFSPLFFTINPSAYINPTRDIFLSNLTPMMGGLLWGPLVGFLNRRFDNESVWETVYNQIENKFNN